MSDMTNTTFYGKVVNNLVHQLKVLSEVFRITKKKIEINTTVKEENLSIEYGDADKTIDIGLFEYDDSSKKLTLFHKITGGEN